VLSRITLVLALTLSLAGCGINAIPTLEEQAKAEWSQVLNQYQRRADLIPNLVATVEGFAEQERTVLTEVVEARAQATGIEVTADDLENPALVRRFQDAQQELSRSLGRLLVVVERYPELRSSENFLTLQTQLEGTENRIAIARRDYIDAVRRYNTELKTFPGRIWAATLYTGHEPMATFTVEEETIEPPSVDFRRDPEIPPSDAAPADAE
jgi:LemA protein